MYAKVVAVEGEAGAGRGRGQREGDGGGSGGKGVPTLEQRKAWAENLFKVTGDELGHVVAVLDRSCPSCLEVVEAGEGGEPGCEVNVDAVGGEAFWELDGFMKRSVATKQGGKKRKR